MSDFHQKSIKLKSCASTAAEHNHIENRNEKSIKNPTDTSCVARGVTFLSCVI
jgi:hypothetical protein